MIPRQKRLIRELLKKYSEHVGTESLIAFVAETNGMLAAGRTLLQSIETGNSLSTDWLIRDCLQYNVVLHSFIEEISRLVAIFEPSQDKEDHFTTLGISPGAGRDEIKQAYRALSLQSHPDTASPQHRGKSEKFIAINKAYHALLAAQVTEKGDDNNNTPSNQWQENRTRKFPSGQKKKLVLWASAALVILIIVATVASINIKNRAMLAGLHRGRTVSAISIIPATNTVSKNTLPEAVPDSSHEPQRTIEQKGFDTQSLPQKPLPVIQIEQTVQPLPQPVKITNITRLPDAHKIPFAEKPLANKPSVVHLTKQHLKRKSAQAVTSIDAPADTLPGEKEIKFVTIPGNSNNNQVVVPTVVKATMPVTSAKTIEKKQVQPDIKTRIDTFLADYIKAYQQRNLISFSSFFAADAVENGKPFASMFLIYKKLFATTSAVSLKVEKISWQQLDEKISVQGSFKVHVQYNNSHIFSGSGPIHFVLMDNNGSYRVSMLEYNFLVP